MTDRIQSSRHSLVAACQAINFFGGQDISCARFGGDIGARAGQIRFLDLLPVRDKRFDDYALRKNVRGSVGKRKDGNDTFSTGQRHYLAIVDDMFQAIDKGDTSIGLPAYNGGLFNRDATPWLATAKITDNVMADVIDLLSFERIDGQLR